MQYWSGLHLGESLLWIIVTIGVMSQLRRVGWLNASIVPPNILLGIAVFTLGPEILGALTVHVELLEALVYHALAVLYIAVSLQPAHVESRGEYKTFAMLIPLLAVLQGLVGLGGVLAWNAVSEPSLHPGFGLMFPLGYNQSPGTALSLGSAWERDFGFQDGAQLGLIIASIGFAWCALGGAALLWWARRKNWVRADVEPESETLVSLRNTETDGSPVGFFGAAICVLIVYALTWAFLYGVTHAIPLPGLASTLWGFHFLIGTGFAVLIRKVWLERRTTATQKVQSSLTRNLGRIGNAAVDVGTVAALGAVQWSIVRAWGMPLAIFSTSCGLLTLITCVWLGRRLFESAPFQHTIVLFGAMTGTAPTGLALLRTLDPELSGPAARNYIASAGPAALLALPLFALMRYAVSGYLVGDATPVIVTLALLVVYALMLLGSWLLRNRSQRRFRPLWPLWP